MCLESGWKPPVQTTVFSAILQNGNSKFSYPTTNRMEITEKL